MLLTKMLRDDDNKYCVDCDAKGPRWASWNLGVFLCIRCAGIHRNLGVHISRVKSVNLDSWTPEQVVSLEQMGNSRARAVYEAMLPDGFRRPQTDSSLESFIRAKYEHKKYLAREWVPPPPPKVDWDREIDEEIERQKRKKKSSSTVGSVGSGTGLSLSSPLGSGGTASNKKSVATSNSSSSATGASSSSSSVPKLKAPASSLKSSNRNSTASATDANTVQATSGTTTLNTSANSSAGADLLGLSLNESITGSIGNNSSSISGTSTANGSVNNGIDLLERKSNATDDLAKAEADFFNQSASGAGIGGDAGNSKLTKDKIMALYGSGPAPTMAGAGAFGGGGFGGFQQAAAPATVQGGLGPAGSTFPSAVNMQPFNNGQPTNAFGAFQTFPSNAAIGGASGMMNGNQPPLAGGQYVMPHGQPMMYGNSVANGGAIPPMYAQTVIGPITVVPPQYPGMMAPSYAANHLLQQQQQQQHPQPSVMGFPPMAGAGAAGLDGVPAFATFPNSVPQQQQHQQQPQLQPTASDKLNNQFGTMNLRDVWQ
ncbi:hypothetical protein AND_005802 [Anopheles darlingi]|uniref:Arf-GAP domain-containing protein n=1 Tax=Anopheles darlingi TaxID=43151 RepID=W5JDQ5_ANODA|nr:hypothetical protein AND_005802 [Anopheles darlingi]